MSANQSFTQGPWKTQAVETEGDERGVCFVIGANLGGLVGASLPWPTELDSGDFSRVAANARLIAAAPALLAAAKVAIKEMCNTVAPRDSFTNAVDMLDAAISLAESASEDKKR